MKNIINALLVCLALFFLMPSALAQKAPKETVTAEFKVGGICDMCKKRIEAAALIKGVKYANWKKETGMLTVIYKNWKTTENQIHQAIVNVGHSTSLLEAKKEVYEGLPMCCHYNKDGMEVH